MEFCGPQTPIGLMNVTLRSLKGAPLDRAPDFTANLGARYTTGLAGGDLVLSGNLYYTSKFFLDVGDQYVQNGYALLGLRAEWTNPSGLYTLAVYGDNVTDTTYRTSAFATQDGAGNAWGAPATYGAEIKFQF
jgi:iron complex outermembrane receptor protein